MKALILNSGMGSRMGAMSAKQPKCMTEISGQETILSRQLRQIMDVGIRDVIITTGPFENLLTSYVRGLDLPLHIDFVNNPDYRTTNYIYSIYCAREYLSDDLLLLHGDLVFENSVIDHVMEYGGSCMVVSSTEELPQKDFKAVVRDGRIDKIGVEFFHGSMAAQPLYKIGKEEWQVWLQEIVSMCESGERSCYAEHAFNLVSGRCNLHPLDIRRRLCREIDDAEDLAVVSAELRAVENRIVYISFATDMLHSGHISILRKAGRLGRILVGVLSDEAVACYRRIPLLPFEERKNLFESVAGVYRVVEQRTLSYRENLERYRPDYVVHGDDWLTGVQKPIRDEVVSCLASYGGKLVEYPHADGAFYRELERRMQVELSLPDMRRARLKRAMEVRGLICAIEAHSGLTGLIAEKTVVYQGGNARQFDAMWISSLCDSTAKGKPDIELVDMTSRFRTVDDIMDVTTKPIIFDGDTGGLKEHFVYTVRTLERMGVSMVIIEDKKGLKKNSLFGTEVKQTQDSIEHFCEKIRAGKRAQKTKDFMICARIESLILERGMEDALKRARAYVEAGADAIMIHSRKKDPTEIFSFIEEFRIRDGDTPLVVVPTAFNEVTEEEFRERGVNIVIYANHLTRTSVPAMQRAAAMILEHHRAKECDDICMPFRDIIELIPEEI